MKPSFLISLDDGKLYDREELEVMALSKAMKKVSALINKWDSVRTQLIMNQADFDDIVKFSKED